MLTAGRWTSLSAANCVPQARLDLHGMTQDQAHTALVSFMADAQADGKRCVIVITGRGRISEGGGVLRNRNAALAQCSRCSITSPRLCHGTAARWRFGRALCVAAAGPLITE